MSGTIIINLLYFKTWILSLELHAQWGILIFKVFSSSFCRRLSTQGQLISKSVILLLSLSTILVSTLLASTSVWSTYTGTSQKAVIWLFSYIGLGCMGKYQGGTDSIRLMTEKIWIEVNLIQWLQIHVVLNHLYLQSPWFFTCPSLTSVDNYRRIFRATTLALRSTPICYEPHILL